MVVIAAMPRARPIVTAAGMLRAALIVCAQHRVDADPVFAGATGIAIFVDAALGTDIGGLAVATDETITAIVLIGVLGGRHDCTAALARTLAAIGHRGADTGIADLAIAAVAIVAAGGAIAAVTGSAAQQVIAAAQLLIEADTRWRNAAFVLRDAFVAATAGVAVQAADLEALMLEAALARTAIGIDVALTEVALTLVAVAKLTFALTVFATEFAVGARTTSFAAEVIDRAFVIDATDRAFA